MNFGTGVLGYRREVWQDLLHKRHTRYRQISPNGSGLIAGYRTIFVIEAWPWSHSDNLHGVVVVRAASPRSICGGSPTLPNKVILFRALFARCVIFVWSRQLGRRDYSIGIWVMSELRVEFEMEDGSENQAEGRLKGCRGRVRTIH